MMSISEILREGYAVVAGRTCAAGPPRFPAGELQAFIAFCSAEMDRMEQTDREIRNVAEAHAEIAEANAELISAYQRIDTALAFVERDKHHGWLQDHAA
jgi:hypothetical protein